MTNQGFPEAQIWQLNTGYAMSYVSISFFNMQTQNAMFLTYFYDGHCDNDIATIQAITDSFEIWGLIR